MTDKSILKQLIPYFEPPKSNIQLPTYRYNIFYKKEDEIKTTKISDIYKKIKEYAPSWCDRTIVTQSNENDLMAVSLQY